jgi:hypothetical protein
MLLRKADELQDLLEGFTPEPQIEAEAGANDGKDSNRKVKGGVRWLWRCDRGSGHGKHSEYNIHINLSL